MSEPTITKRCSKCKQIKPVSEFHKRNDRKCGFSSQCKICRKTFADVYAKTERFKEIRKAYSRTKKCKAYHKKYKQTEKYKEYQRIYDSTPEQKAKHRIIARTNYAKNREAKLAYSRIYRKTVRYRRLEKLRRIKYAAKKTAQMAVHNAIKKGALGRPEKSLCFVCLIKNAEHYHHTDYSEPLLVFPVCQKCHFEIHHLP